MVISKFAKAHITSIQIKINHIRFSNVENVAYVESNLRNQFYLNIWKVKAL